MKYKTETIVDGENVKVKVMIMDGGKVVLTEERLIIVDEDTEITVDIEEYAKDYAENILLVDMVRKIKKINGKKLNVKVKDKYGLLNKYPKLKSRLVVKKVVKEIVKEE